MLGIRGAAVALWVALALSAVAAAQVPEEPQSAPQIPWRPGEGVTPIGDGLAEIDLSDRYVWLDADGTREFMEVLQNPVSGNELATVSPRADEENWFLVFEFEDIGYIEDADAEKLDAALLLESFRKGTEESNRARRARGWAEMEIVGWDEEPSYDTRTQNLSWAIIGRSGGNDVINRNTRLLGRRGVMSAVLVAGREELDAARQAADELLGGYRFRTGSRYADFVPGSDTIAKVGLAGLITGGAAVGLAKAGLLKKLWKPIALGAAALVAGARRLFRGRNRSETPA